MSSRPESKKWTFFTPVTINKRVKEVLRLWNGRTVWITRFGVETVG